MTLEWNTRRTHPRCKGDATVRITKNLKSTSPETKKTTKDHTKPVPMVRVAHKCGRVLRDEHKWQTQPSKWEIGNPNALAWDFVGQYAWLTADGLQSCERNFDRREHSAWSTTSTNEQRHWKTKHQIHPNRNYFNPKLHDLNICQISTTCSDNPKISEISSKCWRVQVAWRLSSGSMYSYSTR